MRPAAPSPLPLPPPRPSTPGAWGGYGGGLRPVGGPWSARPSAWGQGGGDCIPAGSRGVSGALVLVAGCYRKLLCAGSSSAAGPPSEGGVGVPGWGGVSGHLPRHWGSLVHPAVAPPPPFPTSGSPAPGARGGFGGVPLPVGIPRQACLSTRGQHGRDGGPVGSRGVVLGPLVPVAGVHLLLVGRGGRGQLRPPLVRRSRGRFWPGVRGQGLARSRGSSARTLAVSLVVAHRCH